MKMWYFANGYAAMNNAHCTLWSSFPCWSAESCSRKKIFRETPDIFALDKYSFFAKAVEGNGGYKEGVLNNNSVEIDSMEKRSFTRIPLQAKALVRSKDTTVIGVIENLGLDGIFLKTPEKLWINRVVKIELLFTGTSSQLSILLNGKILRHEKTGMAIQFKDIDLDAFFHLKNLIKYNTDEIHQVKQEFQQFGKK